MTQRKYKIAIYGAASLLGKELAEALDDSSFAGSKIALLDSAAIVGRLEAVGDEITFVQAVEEDSFSGVDFAFLASAAAGAKDVAAQAAASGATVIDLTGALESVEGSVLQSPWLESPGPEVRLDTTAVVVANPAASALALIAERLVKLAPVEFYAATVLEPASEHGREAMDELHQQTVKLLSFQPLPKDIYDAQTAFNLLIETGEDARVNLQASEERIATQYAHLGGARLPELLLQLAHAPVFHGFVISVAVRLGETTTLEKSKIALSNSHVRFDEDAPSNLSVAGQDGLLLRVRSASNDERGRDFRIWIAFDNLRVAVLQAVQCAEVLRTMRPSGQLQ